MYINVEVHVAVECGHNISLFVVGGRGQAASVSLPQ